jgi:hypothetical protein
MSNIHCARCGKVAVLIPLHGEKGGPRFCQPCFTDFHVKQGRERRNKARMLRAFGFTGLGFEEPGELYLELLKDAVTLTHPDRHPPERKDFAGRVTAELLALEPYVAPKPPPRPKSEAPLAVTAKQPVHAEPILKPSRPSFLPTFPCEDCSSTVPFYYCDACSMTWDANQKAKREKTNAAQRRRRVRRRAMTPLQPCAMCGEKFKPTRKDARFCSGACRQRAHRGVSRLKRSRKLRPINEP